MKAMTPTTIFVTTRRIFAVWLPIIIIGTSMNFGSIAVNGFLHQSSLSNNHCCAGGMLFLENDFLWHHRHDHHKSFSRSRRRCLSSKSSLNEGDDDFFFEDNEKDALEGQTLAKEFYEQLRSREIRTSTKTDGDRIEEELYERASSTNTVSKQKNKKFTGRQGELDSTGTPSAGLFDRSNGSVYGYPVDSNRGSTAISSSNDGRSAMVREQMMQSEYRLASLAGGERSIVIQLGLALIALCAVLYVGISGGITDGSERLGLDSDPMPDIIDYATSSQSSSTINDVIRTSPTDGSIWL